MKLLKGHVRSLRSSLEDNIGYRVPVRHPVMSWLVRHAANVVTWCAKGHDDQTAYQRVRLRQFTTRLLGFGEVCSFKNRAHEPIANSMGGRRFNRGVSVGIDRRTGRHMLHCDDGIELARTVMRNPDSEKWSKDDLPSVHATPWNMFESKDPEVVFQPRADGIPVDGFQQKQPIARRVYLCDEDFEVHGYTRVCPK